MENKLYLYMINSPLKEIAENPESFWECTFLVEYNQDNGEYKCFVPLSPECYLKFATEKSLFSYMDEYSFKFISEENVLGGIWQSYPMAILEGARWVGEIEFIKEQWEELRKDW